MRKVVTVNYPKKKIRLKLEDLGNVSEPERCSVYQMLQENLKLAKRTTFLHRIIYVGSHKFPSFEEAKSIFQNIITRCNETYCLEKLTGFFLLYPEYFVHMVEGDEDNLNKHLSYLLDKTAEHYSYLGTIKLLIHVSNINQRFFEDWVTYTGSPSKLLEKLDINADLQQSGRYIYNCIKKLYLLMGVYAEDMTINPEGAPVTTTTSLDYTSSLKLYASQSRSSMSDSESGDRSTNINQRDYKYYLPEYELLGFIIHSNFTMMLQEYFDLYGVVPMRDIYKDRVWPVPHDFIPYDVFEKPFNCVTELARPLRKPGDGPASALSEVASMASLTDLSISKGASEAPGDGDITEGNKESEQDMAVQN